MRSSYFLADRDATQPVPGTYTTTVAKSQFALLIYHTPEEFAMRNNVSVS
jgi:hypothetical protein